MAQSNIDDSMEGQTGHNVELNSHTHRKKAEQLGCSLAKASFYGVEEFGKSPLHPG
jgi:hypothetical protein